MYGRVCIFVFLLVFSGPTFAQVVVHRGKAVFNRTAPNLPDHKKTFEVSYPTVKGVASKRISDEIERTLSYWENFGTSLHENLTGDTWLDRFDFEVNYNDRGLLDITLYMEGSSAYADVTAKTLVIDVATGRRIRINDVFGDIARLILKIDRAHQDEIRKARLNASQQGAAVLTELDQLLGDKRFSVRRLDQFSISNAGVTFLYDYRFPHTNRDLEPEGKYFFSWQELSPHIRKDGLLRGFGSSGPSRK